MIDPANRVHAPLNLLIEDGKVAALTRERPQADEIIDAAGKVVAPGFIDLHMHEDPVGADGAIEP
ncbi:MAG TPA: amidohydrolase family protein, partial [Holophaga sp.]|nr:amidohydrolase family protein [Holophaga sp.]